MRAAGKRSHRRGIAERAAQRRRGEQRRIGRIEADAAGDVGGVPGDGLLIVQDELRPAGRAGGGEGEAGRFARGLVRAGIGGCIAVKRQYRQAGDLGVPAGGSSPITQRSAGRSCAGRAARIEGKSTGANPHSVTNSTARERRRRLPTSAARKRVLTWIAGAPSRAQAKIAARYPVLFGSHSATRTPAPTPAAWSPAAARSTRSWKECRLSVPAASVTAAAAGSRSGRDSSAPSVRGYPAP
jgi:hypothetical protein